MSALSKPLADLLYNHILKNTLWASPTTVYLALHDSGGGVAAHPGKTAAAAYGNEVSYTGYQREAIVFGAPGGATIADGANSAAVTFEEVPSGAADFNVTGLSLWTDERGASAGASGTLLLAAPIDALKEMTAGDVPLVAIGSINATFGTAL